MSMHEMLEKKFIPQGSGLVLEKRIFSDMAIQGQIDQALKGVEGKGAVLDVRLDNNRVAAVMAARLNDQWSMGLVVEREHTGDLSAGAKVVFDW
jgi:hypothetical protein